jgi:pimeloyl-ACP methyl ester carboxylesterase
MRGDLVMVPGLCVSAYLRPACHALALAGFDVRLVDPPGWPRTPPPAVEPHTLHDLARPVAAWIAGEALTGVTLVGQSVGAQVAAHVATLVPDRVRLLVLQGPTFDPRYRTAPRAAVRWLADLPREPVSLAVAEVPDWARVGPRRVARTLRLALDDRPEETLERVTAPVAVVVGERDTLSTRAWSGRLASPGRHVVMAGLPHSSPHVAPGRFARVVLDQLNQPDALHSCR